VEAIEAHRSEEPEKDLAHDGEPLQVLREGEAGHGRETVALDAIGIREQVHATLRVLGGLEVSPKSESSSTRAM
jgi:hypothetical protein